MCCTSTQLHSSIVMQSHNLVQYNLTFHRSLDCITNTHNLENRVNSILWSYFYTSEQCVIQQDALVHPFTASLMQLHNLVHAKRFFCNTTIPAPMNQPHFMYLFIGVVLVQVWYLNLKKKENRRNKETKKKREENHKYSLLLCLPSHLCLSLSHLV